MGPWLVDRQVRCVRLCPFPTCVCVCILSKNHFFPERGRGRAGHTPVCLYWSHSVSLAKSSHCFSRVLSIKTVCRCLDPSTYIHRLGSSILGSHFGLLDGGQIGSSNGQHGSSAKERDKRDNRNNWGEIKTNTIMKQWGRQQWFNALCCWVPC